MIEKLLILSFLYISCGVFTQVLYFCGDDWDAYDIHEYLIAWPLILVALFVKASKKAIKHIKE